MAFSRKTLSKLTYDPSEVEQRLWGYARVSTTDQRLDLQIEALKRAGVPEDMIYVEKMSGAAIKRPELAKVLKACREGDTLVVWRLDRFGRDMSTLIANLKLLQMRGVEFRSLTENIDTKSAVGWLLIHLLGAVAQFERNLTQERTRAGVREHQRKGGRHGAPLKLDLPECERLLRQGKSMKEVAEAMSLIRGKHVFPSNISHHFPREMRLQLAKEGPIRPTKKRRK